MSRVDGGGGNKFMNPLLFAIGAYLFSVDAVLYFEVVKKYGYQGKHWPGSGIYLWWKYRKRK